MLELIKVWRGLYAQRTLSDFSAGGGKSMSVRMPVLLGARPPGKPLGRPDDWPFSPCPVAPPSQKPFDFAFFSAMAGDSTTQYVW
jgi:hypothetical protein